VTKIIQPTRFTMRRLLMWVMQRLTQIKIEAAMPMSSKGFTDRGSSSIVISLSYILI
jgi:hypothetical protein